MPSQEFEYHPDAILEAHSAFHWYADRNPSAADRFWNEVVRARKLVVENPEIWTPYYHGTRILRFRRFPYGLVYINRSDKIIGVSVCHLHREPGYWRERL